MSQKKVSGDELRNLAWLLAAAAVLAIASVFVLQSGGYAAVAAICVLIILAAFATGSALGFIFGLPRVFSDDAQSAKTAAAPATGQPDPNKRRMKSNANLERVSDWLTTMIVGVALTQLVNIGKGLYAFQQFLKGFSADCTPKTPCSLDALVTAGPILLIASAVAGFLFMYLYTRLLLTPVFNDVEVELDSLTPDASAKLISLQTPKGVRGAAPQSTDPPLSVEAALQLMFAALYEDPPAGYEKAINISGVLSNSTAVQRADYWFYMAAAFGQKLNHLFGKKLPDVLQDLTADQHSALDNAIDAAQRAVRIDPAYKARLISISHAGTLDDDLQLVALDPRWTGIVS
jgi:hypothetical protein